MTFSDALIVIGGSRPFLSDGEIDMYIGIITSESASLPVETTDHAIEEGSTVQSHAKISPESFSLSVKMGGSFSLSKAIYNAISDPRMPELTVADKIDKLREWRRKKQLLTYSGPRPGYALLYQTRSMLEDNIIITNIDESRTNKADAWEIGLSFKRMNVVKAMMTTINLPKTTQQAGQTPKSQDGSKKPPKESSIAFKTLLGKT